jgi:hypothetical protein
MGSGAWLAERRQHARIHLGLPVRVHFAGEPRTLTLELANVSVTGCYVKTGARSPRIGQWIALGFVDSNRSVCTACGRTVRKDDQGFALEFERTNLSFRDFLGDISGSFVCAA